MAPPGWLAGVFKRLVNREMIEAIQLLRLRRTVSYAAARSPFYRGLFDELGIKTSQELSLEGLSRLPFTTSEEMAEEERFLCVPRHEIGHIFSTSGTTGEPKHVYFTFEDMRRSINMARALVPLFSQARTWLPQHIVALIALPQGLWIGSHQAIRIVEGLRGLALPINLPDPEETMEHLIHFQPNVFTTSPSYLGALTKVAEENGFRQPIHCLALCGELLLPEQEQYFADFWQAQVLNIYGTTEIGGGQAACLPGCQGLHLNELGMIAEIVDPETEEACERGELVFTTLGREAMPLLRYRTGDIARWVQCPCGLPARSFAVEGRLGDMFIAGAVNLYGRVIASAISRLRGATGRIDIILEKEGLIDCMELLVERRRGQQISLNEIHDVLLRAYPNLALSLRNGALRLDIVVVDSLRPSAKAFRIVDRRYRKTA